MKTKNKIDPEAFYNLQDIQRDNLFPWAKGRWAIREAVALDQRGSNLLKPKITGTGRGNKYHFKGANIIKFVEAFASGK